MAATKKKATKKKAVIKKKMIFRKKKSPAPKKSEDHKKKQKAFKIIKKAIKGVGHSISHGTDKLADVIVDTSKNKGKRLKKETISMVKDMASGAKRNLKDLKLKNIVFDASYGLGKISKITKKKGSKLLKGVI